MQTSPQDTPYYNDVTPETSLRLVDQALTDWLASLRFRNQTPRVTNVWQSRQFAQNHEMKDGQPTKQAKVWPVVSLSMTGIVPAIDRRVVAEIGRLGLTGMSVPTETLGTGDGTARSYEGRLGHFGIVPGSLVITAGAQSVGDDGEGTLVGNTGTGPNTIDYDTSLFGVSFATNVPNGTAIVAAYETNDSKIYADNQKNSVFVLPFPLPFDLSYQIDIWTKTQQDMQALRTALLCRFPFADETYLDLEVPGYGTQMVRLSLSRIDDNTDLEPGEADRELRNTVSVTAHAWIYRVALKKNTIKSLNVVLIDAGTEPENLEDGSRFLDWYCDIDHYTFGAGGDPPGVLSSVQESPTLAPPNRILSWMSWVDGNLTKVGP